MAEPWQEERVRRIVLGVLEEALRSTAARGFMMAGEDPEASLLESWLKEGGFHLSRPTDDSRALASRLLESAASSDLDAAAPPVHARNGQYRHRQASTGVVAEELAALATANSRDLLLLGSSNKTCLLLSPRPTVAPILPLGDVYASQVLDLCSGCTVPSILQGGSEETVRAVDGALSAYLEDGFGMDEALAGLPLDLRSGVVRGLTAASRVWRMLPLVPKLTKSTLGIDLDL